MKHGTAQASCLGKDLSAYVLCSVYYNQQKPARVFVRRGGGVQIFMSTSVHLAPDGASTIPASAQLITDTYAYVVHKDICKGVKL